MLFLPAGPWPMPQMGGCPTGGGGVEGGGCSGGGGLEAIMLNSKSEVSSLTPTPLWKWYTIRIVTATLRKLVS